MMLLIMTNQLIGAKLQEMRNSGLLQQIKDTFPREYKKTAEITLWRALRVLSCVDELASGLGRRPFVWSNITALTLSDQKLRPDLLESSAAG